MSTTITLEEAQVSLSELIHRMAPGEEVVITENQQPVARLVSELKSKREPIGPLRSRWKKRKCRSRNSFIGWLPVRKLSSPRINSLSPDW